MVITLKWFRENWGWIKWVLGIIYSAVIITGSSYLSYQKMKWDIDQMKKDMETANIIELKAKVDGILETNKNINEQLNIILQHLINN